MKLSFDQKTNSKNNPIEIQKPRKKFANKFSKKKGTSSQNTDIKRGPTIESHGFDYSDTVAPRIVTTDIEQEDIKPDEEGSKGIHDEGLDFFDYDEPDESTSDSTMVNGVNSDGNTIDAADQVKVISEQDASINTVQGQPQKPSTGRNKLFIYGSVAGILLALALSVMFFMLNNGNTVTIATDKGPADESVAIANGQTVPVIDHSLASIESNEAGVTVSQPVNEGESNSNETAAVNGSASQNDEFAESAKAVVDAETQAAIDAALGKSNPAEVMNNDNATAMDNSALNANNHTNDKNGPNGENLSNENLDVDNSNSGVASDVISYEDFLRASETPIKIVKESR